MFFPGRTTYINLQQWYWPHDAHHAISFRSHSVVIFEITKSKLTKKVYMDKLKINCFPQNRYMRNHLIESVARVTEPPNGWGWKAHVQLSVH